MKGASPRSIVSEVLVRLLRAYSPSGMEDEAVEAFTQLAEELGYPRVWVDGAGNAHASTGEGPPKVALVGHIDTVPGEIPVSRKNGVIKGRGAVDAKGPLAAFLTAAALAKVEGCTVQVSALVGEEADSPGARFLRDTGFYAPYMVIGEPTNTTGIAVGYKGSATVYVECSGKGGHSSSPEVGDSALDKILESINVLRMTKGVSVSVVELHAWSPTRNVLPTKAYGYLDVRLGFGVGLETITRVVLPESCSFTVNNYTPPVKVKPQNPVPRAIARALLTLGLKPRILIKRGTSDMNLLYPCCAGSVAAYGPGNPVFAHNANEYIFVDDLELAVNILKEAVGALCFL